MFILDNTCSNGLIVDYNWKISDYPTMVFSFQNFLSRYTLTFPFYTATGGTGVTGATGPVTSNERFMEFVLGATQSALFSEGYWDSIIYGATGPLTYVGTNIDTSLLTSLAIGKAYVEIDHTDNIIYYGGAGHVNDVVVVYGKPYHGPATLPTTPTPII
jgi:hypothetical protein